MKFAQRVSKGEKVPEVTLCFSWGCPTALRLRLPARRNTAAFRSPAAFTKKPDSPSLLRMCPDTFKLLFYPISHIWDSLLCFTSKTTASL